jgi:hypothetical protein
MSCIYIIRNAINGHERFGWRYIGKANNDKCLAAGKRSGLGPRDPDLALHPSAGAVSAGGLVHLGVP